MPDTPTTLTLGALALVLWGVIDCFFGYRIVKFTIGLLGLIAGGWLGFWIVLQGLGMGEGAAWIGFLVGALLGALLAFGMYLVGLFLLGFSLGFTLSLGLVHVAGDTQMLLTGLAVGLISGALAVLFQRLVIIIATAWVGALKLTLGLAYFVAGIDWLFYVHQPDQIAALFRGHPWMFPAVLVVGAVGVAVQWPATGRRKK
jgi:hypothetical protein